MKTNVRLSAKTIGFNRRSFASVPSYGPVPAWLKEYGRSKWPDQQSLALKRQPAIVASNCMI